MNKYKVLCDDFVILEAECFEVIDGRLYFISDKKVTHCFSNGFWRAVGLWEGEESISLQ